MNMKQMTALGLMVGVVAVAGSVWAADGWMSWLTGKTEAAKPVAAAPKAAAAAPAPAMAMMGNALDIQPDDRVIGSMTAPITMIEYASMTCSHCADFATKTMPDVKKDWIATGKVKYVLRDLAWDNLAMGMAKVARCAPASQFMPIADTFFANQSKIVLSAEPLGEIKKLMVPFGMDGDKVEACVKDAALHQQVEQSKKIAMETLGVRGTPAVFINGSKVDGAVDYFELKKVLEAAYQSKGAK